MRISLAQMNIVWGNPQANLQKYREIGASLKGKSDLLILPEMCANGFGSHQIESIAQYNNGFTISSLQEIARDNNLAITGSFAAKDEVAIHNEVAFLDGLAAEMPRLAAEEQTKTLYYNRGFFIYPDGRSVFFNKRHLFRVGNEGGQMQFGEKEPCIVHYKGVNIRLIICYDLRFPVWCRNVQQAYDLMICVANWPECRIKSWNNMLEARATENQAYVCGVNRVGEDITGLPYNGASAVYSAIGEELLRCADHEECVETIELDMERLQHQRDKFPAWKDADIFDLIGGPASKDL